VVILIFPISLNLREMAWVKKQKGPQLWPFLLGRSIVF